MMDRKVYPVEITLGPNKRPYSPEFQTLDEYKEGWKRVLLMAHGKADVRCTCPGAGAVSYTHLTLPTKRIV